MDSGLYRVDTCLVGDWWEPLMRVVVLVPYRGDGGRRDILWSFTRAWLEQHHPEWPIVLGESPEGPFNRGAAINDAARKATPPTHCPWDVAVIHDSDNISDPDMLRQAVERAHEVKGCVYPHDTYLYLDEFSTDRLLAGGSWFVCPEDRDSGFKGVIRKHSSGVQCLSREAYDAIGGYVELTGWGSEDCATGKLIKTFVKHPIEHLEGGAYHLYHFAKDRAWLGPVNHRFMQILDPAEGNPARLRELMSGHPIPGDPIRDVVVPVLFLPDTLRSPQQYWIETWKYLNDRPEIRFAFLIKEDVRQLNDPFPHMYYDKLYIGSEPGPNVKKKKRWLPALLDCSVVGGDRCILLQFCARMISEWAAHFDSNPSHEYEHADRIARIMTQQWRNLVTGPQVMMSVPVESHPIAWFSCAQKEK